MLKKALTYFLFILLLASCSALKPLALSGKDQAQQSTASEKKEVKFLDNIDAEVEKGPLTKQQSAITDNSRASDEIVSDRKSTIHNAGVEKASLLQLKYSLLLNTEVENVQNIKMFEFIDEWYGTRYRLGGNTKSGIDCSAFTQFLFLSVYGVNLPRTAREQHSRSSRISRTHLQQGDLIFFNTRGGISHVGVYLQNNKFVHASTTGGVTISDLFDPYWLRRFIGVGRINTEMAKQ